MDWIHMLLSRCVGSDPRQETLDADLDEELRAHIDLAILENLKRGMALEEARAAALRAFGGVTQIKERYRSQRGFSWAGAARDIRYAARQLRRSPGFALTAIVTLALGIGAATSVFSVVNAVLLRPFAFRQPDRLMVMREVVENPEKSERSLIPVNFRHYLRLKNTATTLEDAAIFAQRGKSVSPSGDHPRVVGTVVSTPNLFRVLGVQPILGRGLRSKTTRVRKPENVVILSDEGWQSFFARDPSAIWARPLRIEGHPVTVIGVLAAGHALSADLIWRPRSHFQDATRHRPPF